MTEQEILHALSHVDDPDLRKDIVTLNMVKNVKVDGNKVSFDVELTTPACPMKEAIKNACIQAVRHMVSKEAEVEINMTSRVTTQRSDNAVLPNVKNIIAIASGKGGVGKSTVSLNLAWALKESGAKVGLLDADIHGPSIPGMIGIKVLDEQEGALTPVQVDGLKVLSIGFMVDERQPIVWRGPMVASALKQLLSDANWGELDYLIIDLPPGTGDTHLSLVQHVQLSGVIMVTTPQKVAMADCRKAMGMFIMPQINVPVLGIVENMAWFTPKELPENKYFLFGQGGGQTLSDEFKVPLLAQIPIYQSIMQQAESSVAGHQNIDEEAWKYYKLLAGEVARQMAIKNASASLN
jgi:ATP-binding protein involved in chromosome partitioning